MAEETFLILRCKDGSREAMNELAAVYGPAIYGFAAGLTGDKAGACQDKMAAAFTEAVKAFDPQNPGPAFTAWIVRSLMKKIPENRDYRPLPQPDPRLACMLEALGRLGWMDRAFFLMRYQLDFLYNEIAWITGTFSAYVGARLEEIRPRFRSALSETVGKKYAQLPAKPE